MRSLIYLLAIVASLSCQSHKNENLTIRQTVVYNSVSSMALDVTYHSDYTNLRPVLVYVHGGGWCNDDKSEWSPENAQYFLDNGIVSVTIDYTLASDYKQKASSENGIYPTNVDDVANAIEWVRQNISGFGGDPNNIFLMGYSAGTLLVDLAVMKDKLPDMKRYIRGVISIDAGPYLVMNRWMMKVAGVDSFWINAFGTENFKHDELNPVYLVTRQEWLPPFLLVCQNTPIRSDPNMYFNKVMMTKNHTSQLVLVENTNHQDIINFVKFNLPFKNDLVNFIKQN